MTSKLLSRHGGHCFECSKSIQPGRFYAMTKDGMVHWECLTEGEST